MTNGAEEIFGSADGDSTPNDGAARPGGDGPGAAEESRLLVVRDGEPPMDAGPALPFPVVGLGGSAGSLEALAELFHALPPRTGMAYVVVMHLAANQESHLTSILGRYTTMPVVPAEPGRRPEPDHVYVIPPGASVLLRGDRLELEPRPASGPFLPVNDLFQSLATAQKTFALGVVFSGMDGDGALGLRAIKGEGGFALVQAPGSARHASMPLNSIANDHIDMVLPPGELALQLAALSRRFADERWRRLEQGDTTAEDGREYGRILKLLKGVSGVDFRLYKPSTLRRRIARRMVMHKLDSLAEYTAMLGTTSPELRALQQDILINVTRFFRDPEVFEMLKTSVIPRIFADLGPEQQVRVWVAGCSTGEEAYSIAICLLEHLTGSAMEPSVQIFGTDASEENIHRARLGLYPGSIANEVTPERLRRFFVKTDKGYQIHKRVRDVCVFARQNLCTDPPFSRLDLVSCRNVLIYFGPELQQRVISTFHYALRPDGFLLLGSSESIREFTNLFTAADRVHKLFGRADGPLHRGLIPSFSNLHATERMPAQHAPLPGEMLNELDLGRLADRTALARYGPPGVVINAQMEILQTRGRTNPFLEMAPGAASLQLSRMVRDGFGPDVVAAVSRAITDGLPVQADLRRVVDGGEIVAARLEVLPMPAGELGAANRYFLVSFLPPLPLHALPGPEIVQNLEALPAGEPSTVQLRQDLASIRVYLNSLLDEREATNQELISANEEIQSSNEELQSTNEELETTKEELQSSNEELQTVNDELEDRNAILMQASNDLSNLLNSVNLPVLMLSHELHIRHFTPQTQRLLHVRPQDVGRPFGEIRLNLQVDDLEARLLEVLDTLTPQEIEVQDREGRWYFLRIRPYRTTENKIEGLVLVLVDIDQSRRSQQELRDARDFAASVIANTPLPLVVINGAFRVVYVNDAFCELAGMTRQAIDGRVVTELAAGLWSMETDLRTLLENVKNSRTQDGSFECTFKHRNESTRTLRVESKPLQPDGERFMLVTIQDITAHREMERLLKGEGERLATQVAETTRELDRSREELRALTDNLMTSQEDERRRLARELHDDVSQRMALLDMECEAALQVVDGAPAEAREKLQRLRAQVAEISTDVRSLSHRLHPSILEHLGAAAALESLLEEFTEREGTLTSFYAEELPQPLPLELATGLYRITQEALRNVAKHAGKAHVKVSLHAAEGDLVLEVTDSGLGFDAGQHNPGLGLISMKERARLLGAVLRIQSAPRRGTTLAVHVPLARVQELAEGAVEAP